MGFLYIVLLLLVLLLTGTLGVFLGVLGWVLAGIISLVIIYVWWQKLMFPLRVRSEIRTLWRQIQHKTSLGYETAELEERLEELEKFERAEYRRNLENRRSLGYDE